MQVSVEQTSPRSADGSERSQGAHRAGRRRAPDSASAGTAKLKGFRPGKAPLKVIASSSGAQVRQEVLTELMQSSFAEAVTEQKLSPAAARASSRSPQARARTSSTVRSSRSSRDHAQGRGGAHRHAPGRGRDGG